MKSSIVSREYSIAATEILELLNYMPEDLIKEIPVQLINFFNQVSIEDYKLQFDVSQGIENINLTDKTNALLAMIYRNYLCTTKEKQEFDENLFRNEQKYQEELQEKYSPDYVFKNSLENVQKENSQITELIEYKDVKWYQKIFGRILKLLKK